MRMVVDLTKCQGYAQCAFLAPSVFHMQGDEALMYDPSPSDEVREQVLRAAAACPVQAIQIDRVGIHDMPPVHGETAQRNGRVVIVGASLAGLRAAEALREEGFTGSLTLIDADPGQAYDRPPLSKQVLSGWVPPSHTTLPQHDDLHADWRLGVKAVGLDLAGRRVRLDDGSEVPFDRLLIATGVRARPWPDTAAAALDGMFVLRTQDDAEQLRRRLAERPGRVLIIGGGFAGSEIASMCRGMDLAVTVADNGPAPLAGALGSMVGRVAADLQREHGVDLRCETTVTELLGDEHGRLRRARLSDGTELDVDVAVAALGGVRNVDWLQDSGLAAGPWGVACDAGCRAFDANGLVTDAVYVAGDVARTPNPMFGYQFLALEHWSNAVAQAEVAAHNMLSDDGDRWPHLEMPAFWSAQFGVNIKSVGVPSFSDEVLITQGSVQERSFTAVYGFKGRITAAVTFNQGKWLPFYQRLIERAAPFPPQFDGVDQPTGTRPVPAGMRDPKLLGREATVHVTGHDPSSRQATLVAQEIS